MIEWIAAASMNGITSRVPATPLFTHTPYFSAWLMGDKLTDQWPRHWTQAIQAMAGLVRIDGKTYKFCGNPQVQVDNLPQTARTITATKTVFEFEKDGVALQVHFFSPLLAHDLDIMTRPVSYVSFLSKSVDGREHDVKVHIDFSGEWSVSNTGQQVTASRHRLPALEALSMRATGTSPLNRVGDRVTIDWGSLWVTARQSEGWNSLILPHDQARQSFTDGKPPESDDIRFPRSASDDWPVIGFQASLPAGSTPAKKTLMVAYDEDLGLEYFRRPLRPHWNRAEKGVAQLLKEADANQASYESQAEAFDTKLWNELGKVSPEYQTIGTLAYRQTIAGHGVAEDINGDTLMFSKENTSNGCIGTVDVLFPAAPFYLLFNPAMLKAQMLPLMDYSKSSRWKFPFAPHDLGTYPKANGQVYGGGERTEENQMPVEESANMLILALAYERASGDKEFFKPYAAVLEKWASYLETKGFDPELQLCTDDFAGHLAHNTNLSIKAIVALRAHAEMSGNKARKALAEKWAKEWMKQAADGDHYRLVFDKPGTWSLKYNLLWDDLFGFKMFPRSVIDAELNYYIKMQNEFGVPLDSRRDYTKTDWLVWAASMGTSVQFNALIAPVAKWIEKTPSRVPFSDWYDTKKGQEMGMNSRTVVGGVFAKLLRDSGKLK